MYKVLIADDEKIEREGIKFLLLQEEPNCEITEFSNGKQALAFLRSEKVDLLLTDIKMPHMDGLELSEKARSLNENLKIVIFSGYSDFEFAQKALRYGVTDYILKPVEPESFKSTIRKTLNEIEQHKNQEIRDRKEQSFLQQYFLQNYIYTGKKEILEKAGEIGRAHV